MQHSTCDKIFDEDGRDIIESNAGQPLRDLLRAVVLVRCCNGCDDSGCNKHRTDILHAGVNGTAADDKEENRTAADVVDAVEDWHCCCGAA